LIGQFKKYIPFKIIKEQIMSLEQYKDASRKELWDILQIQMQVLQVEVAKVTKLEKENKLLKRVEKIFNDSPDLTFGCCERLFPEEFKAHNLEQRVKGVEDCVKETANNKYRLPLRDTLDLYNYANELRSQAKLLKSKVK
jgi:hypothetical protein